MSIIEFTVPIANEFAVTLRRGRMARAGSPSWRERGRADRHAVLIDEGVALFRQVLWAVAVVN